MPFSAGVFTRTDGVYSGATVFQQERDAGVKIRADRLDTESQDIADGLSTCLLKDGTQTVTANIPMSNFQITGLGSGTTRTAAINVGQVQDSAVTWCGTFGGTANALTANLSPAITAYATGMRIAGVVLASNTAAATIALNGLASPVAVRKKLASGLSALTGGEQIIGTIASWTHNGTYFVLDDKPEWQLSAALTSAATVDLATTTGEYALINGSTGPITAFGTLPAGTLRIVRFASTPTITYNGTSLILPNASNITAAAGDMMVLISEGGGNWRCLVYQFASGGTAGGISQGLHTIDLEGRAFTPRTTNGAASYSAETTTNDVMIAGLAFDQTTSEGAQARFVMPQSWNAGTITARIRWTAAAGTGDVTWGVQAVALRNNVALDTAFGSAVTVTDTLLTVDYEHVTATTSAITIGNSPAKADTIILQVYRDISDTLNADAILLSVEVFMTINAATDA
jgi:hypothetical protein